jgi:signal transduction histidine kinase
MDNSTTNLASGNARVLLITGDSSFHAALSSRIAVDVLTCVPSFEITSLEDRYAAIVVGADMHVGGNCLIIDFVRAVAGFPLILLSDGRIDGSVQELLSIGYSDVYRLSDGSDIICHRLTTYISNKELTRRIEAASQDLQHAEKELDEYVYVVSHDLKAPLRGLSTLASFIEEELSEKCCPSVAELLGMMKSRTERMQAMLDGILHYSRTAGRDHIQEHISVKTLINKAIEEISPTTDVVLEVPDELPEMQVDTVKLKEVFKNLIHNGITHNDESVKRISVTFKDLGNAFEFTVTDNGKGIRKDHQEKVFGLFHTLQSKDNGGRVGLGLAIVKKIVEQQRGKVVVDSTPGSGSAFSFTWNKS